MGNCKNCKHWSHETKIRDIEIESDMAPANAYQNTIPMRFRLMVACGMRRLFLTIVLTFLLTFAVKRSRGCLSCIRCQSLAASSFKKNDA